MESDGCDRGIIGQVILLPHGLVLDERAVFLEQPSMISQMIRKHFVVAAYERKPFWTGWITNRLSIDRNTQVIIAIEHCVQIWNIVALVVLEADA